MGRPKIPLEIRFWNNVNKEGPVHPLLGTRCWLWLGYKDKDGYGETSIERKSKRAHHAAFFLMHGHFPSPQGLHRCDNPPCVNPDHIFEGGALENNTDCWNKGRAKRAKGEKHGGAKLTAENIKQIRNLYATGGITHKLLAHQFNATEKNIQQIITRKRWRHL